MNMSNVVFFESLQAAELYHWALQEPCYKKAAKLAWVAGKMEYRKSRRDLSLWVDLKARRRSGVFENLIPPVHFEQIEKLQKEWDEAIKMLRDVVKMACWNSQQQHYDTRANYGYAKALRYLAELDYFRITSDYGDFVIAKDKEAGRDGR